MQILVLGMHRSGTSAVARLLNLMGVYFGPEGVEMPATPANPKGFWERTDVNRLCVELLRSAGWGWHRLSQFDLNKIPAESLEDFRKEAAKIILGLDAHRPWFLKEPRFCMLASPWLELLETPVCLFVHRSPMQIAKSLQTRDGFGIPFGLALWERYMVSALNATRGFPCLHVDYASVLADYFATVKELKSQLEEIGESELRLPTENELANFIDPSLNHAKDDDEATEKWLSPAQRRLNDGMRSGSLLDSDEPLSFSPEAQIQLLQHDRACERTEEESRVERLTGKIREANTETYHRDKEIASLKARIDRTEESIKVSQQLQAILTRGMETVRQAAKADAAKEIQIAQLREAHGKVVADLRSKNLELVAVREENASLVTEMQRKHSRELAAAKGRLDATNADLAEVRDHSVAAGSRLGEAHAKLDEVWALVGDARVKNLELVRVIKLLKKGLIKIEKYFVRLQESRSFHFFVYTARRLGLVSRTPRQQVELISHQFSAFGKVLKEVDATLAKATEVVPISPLLSQAQDSPEETKIVEERLPPSQISRAVVKEGLDDEKENKAEGVTPPKSIAEPAPDPPGKEQWQLREQSSLINRVSPAPSFVSDAQPSVCIIVLHKSGEEHLRNLFESFLITHAATAAEFMVVLHACQDGSRDLLRSFGDRLKIAVLDFPENHSFAHSNNCAAERSDADYLIFLNNDIIFEGEVVSELVRLLQDARNGLAGLRLHFPGDDPKHPGGLQHGGVKFRPDPKHFFYRPWNVGVHIGNLETPPVVERFPAVTAALVACRRADFLKVGGFCEAYYYGYEDVDLCLTFRRCLGLSSVAANYLPAVHNESTTGKLDTNDFVRARRMNNISQLIRRQGWYLRREYLLDRATGKRFYSDRPITIGFAVTEASASTAAGDYFSASELGDACQREFGWNVRYLSRKGDWYDVSEVDVLVVLLDGYELSKIRNAKPELVTIAWMRNWFERWVTRPDFESYDLFLCSSARAANWVRTTQRKPAIVFPLATNPDRFTNGEPTEMLRSDYCFTGSHWQLPREIEGNLHPKGMGDYEFALFGRGWEGHPALGEYARGFIDYKEIPNVYASTRIVVDDANHVTKGWASVNSRVFDALAAGALVLTNGESGALEVFDGELPVYRNPEELQTLLRHYLADERERRKLAERLRTRVLQRHTYRGRARRLKAVLINRARHSYRIAIKIGAPTRSEIQHWGDYHFARSLGRCLAAEGHSFRIDCIDEWNRPESFGDDVVLVLRGLSRYQPRGGQINLMWNISHPDKVTVQECDQFDHVFVASETYAEELGKKVSVPVSPLLQCTDPFVFYPDPNPAVPHEDLLFVGNSRRQYREVVRCAVEAGLPLAVYGTLWTTFIGPENLRGEYISNSVLRQYYSRCSILLNDHWPSMRDSGFLSNRLFDAAAAGAFVISDRVSGAKSVFGDDLMTYETPGEFLALARHYLERPGERRMIADRLKARVLDGHTFADRTTVILRQIRTLDREKRDPRNLSNREGEKKAVEAAIGALPSAPVEGMAAAEWRG